MRAAGTNAKLSEYEIAEVKEVYRDVKSYVETGRALNISAGVVSQIIRGKGRFVRENKNGAYQKPTGSKRIY